MSYPAQIHTATPAFPSGGVGMPGPPHPPGVATATGPPAAVPDSYFTESRKGEVNELRTLLRNFSTERDPLRKRDIIKKVIAYMTLGIDVSRLFTEMMLAIETRDLVIKKMVYLYLCNYAQTHPELAQMCTNTLQKDCGNDDPMVRGLALRSLCSLNLPQMVEYISEPLRKSLTDHHAYVRKTGVMGILKLYHLDKDSFEQCNFVDILYDMLRDVDASVVSNAILVLNEIMASNDKTNPGGGGGMAINRAIMLHLLNRIHEFSEFAVVQVLELVPRYIPANVDEGYQIMNLLDPVLRTSSCAAVMATVRAFLTMADQIANLDPSADDTAMKRQVVTRVKAPLVTLMTGGSDEIVYCLLKQIQVLVDLCPGVFDDEYRQFYTRYNDPTHVKYLKIQLLSHLANPDTAPDIVAELAELVNDTNDTTVSRLAVRSMARIACRNTGGPGCAESIAQRMVQLLDYFNMEHIQSEAASALTLMVRKHPFLKPVAATSLARTLKYVHEPTGRAAIIYLLGCECGDLVPEAPYALEKLIDSYDDIAEPIVKHALLNATMKLFCLRPPEVQRMLGRLLHKATDDVSSQDLHDRALFYYRLLQTGSSSPDKIKAIINTTTSLTTTATEQFSEENDTRLQAELLDEFNSLAVTYGKASVNFIAPKFQVVYSKLPLEHPLEDHATTAQPPPAAAAAAADDSQGYNSMPATSYESTPAPASYVADLLGFDDDNAAAPAPAPTPQQEQPPSGRLALASQVSMTGEEYQAKWAEIDDSKAFVTTAPLRSIPASTDDIETALSTNASIFTMASGELPNEFKFFLYAQDSTSGSLFLIQSNVSKTEPTEPLMILTIKVVLPAAGAQNAAQVLVDQFMQVLQRVLA